MTLNSEVIRDYIAGIHLNTLNPGCPIETREAVSAKLCKGRNWYHYFAFEPEAPIRVLDLGAGTGGLSLEILGRLSEGLYGLPGFF